MIHKRLRDFILNNSRYIMSTNEQEELKFISKLFYHTYKEKSKVICKF